MVEPSVVLAQGGLLASWALRAMSWIHILEAS